MKWKSALGSVRRRQRRASTQADTRGVPDHFPFQMSLSSPLSGADDGASPPEWTLEASPTTFPFRHIGEAASALNIKELKNLEGILEKRINGIRSKKDIFWQEPLEEFIIVLTECSISREKIM
ncbi:hypothetical protein ACLB2K_050236 [Fragaria x ananassa]